MVTKYPHADWRPLGDQRQPVMSAHDIVCLHTMVGYLTSTDNMFKQNGYGGTESHFGIGGKWGGDIEKGYDGRIFQWQDLEHTADANFQGNHHVISIETADNAPQSANNLAAWTPKQVESIITLVAWLCKKYDIPPFLVHDSKAGRRGIAYHRQGIEHRDGVNSHPGWLISGGERWSTSRGKMCPGDARIKQISSIIVPRVQDILNGDDPEMLPADFTKIQKMLDTHREATVKAVRAEMVKVLTVEPLIPNKPTEAQLAADPAAVTSKASVTWFLSNLELDNDNDREKYLIKIKESIDALVAQSEGTTP